MARASLSVPHNIQMFENAENTASLVFFSPFLFIHRRENVYVRKLFYVQFHLQNVFVCVLWDLHTEIYAILFSRTSEEKQLFIFPPILAKRNIHKIHRIFVLSSKTFCIHFSIDHHMFLSFSHSRSLHSLETREKKLCKIDFDRKWCVCVFVFIASYHFVRTYTAYSHYGRRKKKLKSQTRKRRSKKRTFFFSAYENNSK